MEKGVWSKIASHWQSTLNVAHYMCNKSCVSLKNICWHCILWFTVTLRLYFYYLLQKDVAFYYFGSKFITWMVKIPVYNLRPSYHLKGIKQKFESKVKNFIEEDVEAFATAFGVSVKLDDIKFESFHGGVGSIQILCLYPL